MLIALIWYLTKTSNNAVSDKPQGFFLYVCGEGGGGPTVFYTTSQTKLISGGNSKLKFNMCALIHYQSSETNINRTILHCNRNKNKDTQKCFSTQESRALISTKRTQENLAFCYTVSINQSKKHQQDKAVKVRLDNGKYYINNTLHA